MSDDIHLMSLVELADAIAARQLSAVEVMTATVARAERLQPVLNCFISLQAEAALERAAEADAALARGAAPGPLHGVPLAHKDMFYRAGHVTTCGSRIRRDFVPDHDSTALARLGRAGAIYLGGLNMAEFATGPTGHNEHWGDCRNPWNQAHISGGSSSGSGASVGGRVVYGALGSDTGGSVRLPSACCGVVGLKPTNGLVSRHGLMPLSFTLDTVGPLARTVRDAARITGVIAGHDPHDPTSSRRAVPDYEAVLAEGVEGLRIGMPTDYFYDLATDEVRALMERSLDVFRAAGAEVVEVPVPDIARINHLSNVVLSSEAAAIHEPWITGRPDDYQAQVRNRYEPGLHVPAVKYIQALSARAGLLREFVDTALAGVDALHTPGIPFPIPTRDETNVGGGERMAQMVAGLSWCTRAANYLGGPALIVPCGFTGSGLPAAFQLMGRPFSEETLFRLGHAYQGATDWHTRAPGL
ncbi:MAG: amidase [Rhodospirillales bacterium]|nr:amidase [Rhodospirillales bacterium]MDE0379479.1 amidase [Rhodospirillales bacterium]